MTWAITWVVDEFTRSVASTRRLWNSCSKRQKVHITIVMAWAVMTKPGWGRANSHTNCGNSHANYNNSNEFPNTFAF